MTSVTTKTALSLLAVALLATPALAQSQQSHKRAAQNQPQSTYNNDVGTYPNGAPKTGSAAANESGADFNLQR